VLVGVGKGRDREKRNKREFESMAHMFNPFGFSKNCRVAGVMVKKVIPVVWNSLQSQIS
jgi:hypothetical protein